MQPQQEQNLKKLINASTILTSDEKAEWLVLLHVMNDKQVGDLERILASDKKPAGVKASPFVGTPGAGLAGGQEAKGQMAPPVFKPASAPMPALSHIVNLPTGTTRSALSSPPPIAQEPIKKPSAFAAKLKAMFAEKELPAPTQVKPPLIEPMRGGPASASLPGRVRPPGQQEETLPAPAAKSPMRLPPAIPPPPIKAQALVLKAQLPPKIAAGINFPKISQTDQQDTLKAIKEHIGLETNLAQPAVAKIHPLENINLQDLGDLTLLTPQILAKNDLNTLVNKIRGLISSHSYHEAVFNIEKSELYKTYLATGLKLLTDQINFEELATRPRAEAYLDREEFEKFADLLRQIQIG